MRIKRLFQVIHFHFDLVYLNKFKSFELTSVCIILKFPFQNRKKGNKLYALWHAFQLPFSFHIIFFLLKSNT